MALEHAILVSLAERSASGYDLARRFDASIGHFWPASHQQIYKVLARMESDKLVSADLIAQDGRPDKKVYAITDDGRAELRDWLAKPSRREAVRIDFAVKLRALHLADRTSFIQEVRARRAAHVQLLADYEASEAKFFPDPSAIADEQLGAWLALRGGIRVERGGIEWCDEILQALDGDVT
ncbi:MAG TPA: PadR family transcriptional regulator [Aeromicrobium sp.]|nr:PadR family transcriptional regulator [Aeromicrobium sp.]